MSTTVGGFGGCQLRHNDVQPRWRSRLEFALLGFLEQARRARSQLAKS
jgi:hypothetical protein